MRLGGVHGLAALLGELSDSIVDLTGLAKMGFQTLGHNGDGMGTNNLA